MSEVTHELVRAQPADRAAPYDASRTLDLALAVLLLVLLLPVMLVVGLCVYACDGGPIFFLHNRVGLDGQLFRCIKFRSMCVDAEQRLKTLLASNADARREWADSQKLRDDPRVTPIGKYARQWSLDELPQLLNVVRGEMSLVGPRPITPSEVCRYGRRISSYTSVRPGLTGLWQVSGRSETSYRSRVAMDVTYARARSLSLNLRILFATVPAVLINPRAY